MDRSRMQMDWLRYWTLQRPDQKSTAAPAPARGTYRRAAEARPRRGRRARPRPRPPVRGACESVRMPESAAEVHARVAAAAGEDGRLPTPALAGWDIFPWEVVDGALVPKVLPAPAPEEPRAGETDARPCPTCTRDTASDIWENDRWVVTRLPQPTGLPMVLFLQTKEHLDFTDLDDEMAAEYGRLTIWLTRIMSHLPEIGRVHVNRGGTARRTSTSGSWRAARPHRRAGLLRRGVGRDPAAHARGRVERTLPRSPPSGQPRRAAPCSEPPGSAPGSASRADRHPDRLECAVEGVARCAALAHVDGLDPGRPRPGAAPLDEGVDRVRVTLEVAGHRSVRLVADPAGHAEPAGLGLAYARNDTPWTRPRTITSTDLRIAPLCTRRRLGGVGNSGEVSEQPATAARAGDGRRTSRTPAAGGSWASRWSSASWRCSTSRSSTSRCPRSARAGHLARDRAVGGLGLRAGLRPHAGHRRPARRRLRPAPDDADRAGRLHRLQRRRRPGARRRLGDRGPAACRAARPGC